MFFFFFLTVFLEEKKPANKLKAMQPIMIPKRAHSYLEYLVFDIIKRFP
jgi:hypothetical protein